VPVAQDGSGSSSSSTSSSVSGSSESKSSSASKQPAPAEEKMDTLVKVWAPNEKLITIDVADYHLFPLIYSTWIQSDKFITVSNDCIRVWTILPHDPLRKGSHVVCSNTITNYYSSGEPVVTVLGNILAAFAGELTFWDMTTCKQIDTLQIGMPPMRPRDIPKVITSVLWDRRYVVIHTVNNRLAVWKRSTSATAMIEPVASNKKLASQSIYNAKYLTNKHVLSSLSSSHKPIVETHSTKITSMKDVQFKTGDLILLIDSRTSSVVDMGLVVKLESSSAIGSASTYYSSPYYVWHCEPKDALSFIYLQAKRGLMQLSQLHYYTSRATILNEHLVLAVRGLYRSLSTSQESKLVQHIVTSCTPVNEIFNRVSDEQYALPRVAFCWNKIARALHDVEFGNEHNNLAVDLFNGWFPAKHELLISRQSCSANCM